MWFEERLNRHFKAKNPRFGLCCIQGKVELPLLNNVPKILEDLVHMRDERSQFFLQNIRSFNMMFSFTSLGGKIHIELNGGRTPPIFIMSGENYHRIGSLLPKLGTQPTFA
jgi:hypothetical protein